VGVALAARWASHLTGCFVDPSLRMLSGADSEPTVLSLLLTTDVDAGDGASFQSYTRIQGVRDTSWVATRTGIGPTLRQLGAWHDLAVLERDMVEQSELVDILGEAMLSCRVPCLVLPEHWVSDAIFKRVVVGWNGSIEATRAIHAALPFLAEAKEVVFIDGERPSASELAEGPPPFNPHIYLAHHGIAVRLHAVRADHHVAGEALLKEAMSQKADLLVMGAYGHSRMRERVFGGATRHVLENATIPLLMQH
jgi:nucleotide-binding universal stress UspA family protein